MIPSYLLSQPAFDLPSEKREAFENLWRTTPAGSYIEYHLPHPKWQFLSYLCDSKELVLHGSQNPDIHIIEPRQAHDKRAYSNQKAIYATTDGIWVIYFAILDRKSYPEMSLFNSCLQIHTPDNQLSGPYYFFSITSSVLRQSPWCQGTIYILPRQGFTREASHAMQGVEVIFPHWIGAQPTQPKAKLMVGPQDFPFLDQIHGHNDEKLVELYTNDPNTFPIEAVEC